MSAGRYESRQALIDAVLERHVRAYLDRELVSPREYWTSDRLEECLSQIDRDNRGGGWSRSWLSRDARLALDDTTDNRWRCLLLAVQRAAEARWRRIYEAKLVQHEIHGGRR